MKDMTYEKYIEVNFANFMEIVGESVQPLMEIVEESIYPLVDPTIRVKPGRYTRYGYFILYENRKRRTARLTNIITGKSVSIVRKLDEEYSYKAMIANLWAKYNGQLQMESYSVLNYKDLKMGDVIKNTQHTYRYCGISMTDPNYCVLLRDDDRIRSLRIDGAFHGIKLKETV